MVEKRPPIKLTSRDFDSIKQDLVNYAKVYYPDTYRDFNDASFGAMMFDMVAYVGDILSFYVDYQANESFMDSAIEKENVLKLSKQLGYKQPGAASSTGQCAFFITTPADPDGSFNLNNAPILKRGALLTSDGGATFVLNEDVDFSSSTAEVVVATTTDGVPTAYAIKKYGEVVSGVTETELVSIDSLQKFQKVELSTSDVIEITSVVDSEGNDFFEVEFLSQNTIFEAVKNIDANEADNVPYIMRERLVPRRFVVEYDEDATPTLTFGYGSETSLANNEFPDPSSVILQRTAKNYYSDSSFDPNKILSTDKFGVIPPIGTMTVTYRKNDSDNVNAASFSINQISNANFFFKNDVSATVVDTVQDSIDVENEEPINGQTKEIDIEELRTRAIDSFATQNRAVTRQDYISLIYRMPSKFGKIKRANIVQDKDSFKRNLNLYVVSENTAGNLEATSSTLKNNLKTWLNNYRMMNDTIDILDGKIVNYGIEFELVGKLGVNQNELLADAIERLKDKFSKIQSFGEPLYISEIYKILNDMEDVIDTKNVIITDKTGQNYSSFFYDLEKATSDDGRFVFVPDDVVLELKFPDEDITGVII